MTAIISSRLRTYSIILLVMSVTVVQNTYSSRKIGNAEKSYNNLISVGFFTDKNKRFSDLQVLGALLVKDGLERIKKLRGKDLNVVTQVNTFLLSIKSLIPKNIAPQIRLAYEWASGFDDQQALFEPNFYNKKNIDDGLMINYLQAKDESGKSLGPLKISQLNQFLELELEILNERYKPIIATIKNMKRTTPLPENITDLSKIYNDKITSLNKIFKIKQKFE